MKSKEIFFDFLKTHDLKLTHQRHLIVEEIFSSAAHHFSAEDLLTTVRKIDASISRATVYRTLALLLESHVLEELDVGKGRKYYELGFSHHDHLICLKCGMILEFKNSEIEALQEKVVQKHHFQPRYHSHKIFGYCRDCQKQKK